MPSCNPFDDELAKHGPPAVFLFDREGLLRFDPTWTRDAYGRAPGPHAAGSVWLLLRDRLTGFVTQVFVTSETLIEDWPRADVKRFATREEADAARAGFGTPPVCEEPW